MPTCEGCGEEFPEGGAFATHVRYCDEVDDSQGDEIDLEDRVANLEGEVELIRDMAMDDLDRQSQRVDDLEDNQAEFLRGLKAFAELLDEHIEEFQQFQSAFLDMKRQELVRDLDADVAGDIESYDDLVSVFQDMEQSGNQLVRTEDDMVEHLVDQVKLEGQSEG